MGEQVVNTSGHITLWCFLIVVVVVVARTCRGHLHTCRGHLRTYRAHLQGHVRTCRGHLRLHTYRGHLEEHQQFEWYGREQVKDKHAPDVVDGDLTRVVDHLTALADERRPEVEYYV